jgi:DNA repair exonuclease SbcCD nuclease subunit
MNLNHMQRTKTSRKADAILTGDWHLREDTPVAFQGDFQEEQWTSVDFIADLQRAHGCVVIHTGDLFNHWKPSPYLLTQAMRHLPHKFYTVYGNHDLPQHNLELADKCGINVLAQANYLDVLRGTHWGQIPEDISISVTEGWTASCNRHILVWHVMTYQGKKPWPGCTDPTAASLLRKYPMYDLIATGHNHKTFVEEYEGRLLVNPGGITRQSADQMDTIPCVFLWYADTNTVERVDLPYTEGAISREHIEVVEERDARIDAFISKLNTDFDTTLSFEDNLEAFFQMNNVKSSIKNIIYKSIEG